MDVDQHPVDTITHLDHEFVSTLTPKGGVTIPLAVRRRLKVKPKDKIIFRFQKDKVEIDTIPMSLEDTFGAVKPIKPPENFAQLIRMAKEEHAEKVINKMKS